LNPQNLNGTFKVGSYQVPRSVALDVDSPLTIVVTDNVTVTSAVTLDPYRCDIVQNLNDMERQNYTQTVAATNVASLLGQFYVPAISTSLVYWDQFRYRETSHGSIGHYVQDQICFSTRTQASWCYPQTFLASHWQTQNIAPCTGVIGLGFTTPTFGTNFVQTLAANSNG
jgi:hypothetical protein